MRVLIVDDEPPARARLRRLLSAIPGVEAVAEAGTIAGAIPHVPTADVVLLDAQLDGESGFDLFSRAGASRLPAVIFVTAFDEFAVRAFEFEVVDYLLKPASAPRLAAALARVLKRTPSASASATGNAQAIAPDRIPVKDRGRVLLLRPSEIESVEADGNYLRLHTTRGELLHREALGDFIARLDPARFVRIHRSAVANVGRIVELRTWTNGDRIAVMTSGRELRWSRRYKAERRRFVAARMGNKQDPPRLPDRS